jgi:hypothetical protein
LLKQTVDPILPSSAALVADQAHHPLFARNLSKRIGGDGDVAWFNRAVNRFLTIEALATGGQPGVSTR